MFRRPLGTPSRRALSAALSRPSPRAHHTGHGSNGNSNSSGGARAVDATHHVVSAHCTGVNGQACARGRPPTLFAPSRLLLAPPSRLSNAPPRNRNVPEKAVEGEAEDTTPPSSSSVAIRGSAAPSRNDLSPYDITIESVLLPDAASSSPASTTLRGLVALLLDPNTSQVEAVSLADFASMSATRQLKALGGNQEWLAFLTGTEQYQATKDARALRLAGVTSLGRWDEVPDRVPISPFSRGLLTQAYQNAMRGRRQTQKEEVLTWLTQAIQRAVADEFAAATGGGGGGGEGAGRRGKPPTTVLLPLTSAGAGETEAPPPPQQPPLAKKTDRAQNSAPTTPAHVAAAATAVAEELVDAEVEEVEEDGAEEGEVDDDVGGEEGEPQPTAADVADEAELTRMMAELEAAEADVEREAEEIEEAEPVARKGLKTKPGGKKSSEKEAAWFDRAGGGGGGKRASPSAQAIQASEVELEPVPEESTAAAAADGDEEGEVEEVVEEIIEEIVEEEEEEVVPEGEEVDDAAAEDVAASETVDADASAPAAAATSASPVDPKLARLAQLMLTQFNSADGFLHSSTKKEFKADEKAGYITVMDEDTAQVDPLALFSAFHNAKIAADAPVEVRALKQVWNGFNAHQMLMEDASDPADEAFHRQKSVDALVHGALLMRAISREEEVMLDHLSVLPSYGFPVLSSDTRPYSSVKPKNSPHTDISFTTVETAVKAFKAFFANKEVCNTPFRPRVDVNCGCGVVMLSGTTLHLYETSLKSSIQEDQVRENFAEAMLGVLHVCKNKILPRVNTVHYHIMITSLPGNGGGDGDDDDDIAGAGAARMTTTQDEITSPTTIVSIDMTGPFTDAEKARLRAFSQPLGFSADETREFNCIEDIVMEIDDATGVTVVHDLLQNRDDLEALLTPTLVELLPDEVGEEDAASEEVKEEEPEVEEEEPEEDYPPVKSRPLPVPIPKTSANATKAGKRSAPPPPPPPQDAEEDELVEEEVEEIEEEEEEENVPPPPPSARRKAATKAGKPRRAIDDEFPEGDNLAFDMEAEEEEEDTVVVLRPAAATASGATGKRAGTTTVPSKTKHHHRQAQEEEEVEVAAPSPASQYAAAKHGSGGRRGAAAQGRRQAPPPEPEEEGDEEGDVVEYEEVEEDEEEELPPPPPPPPSRRSTVPPPQQQQRRVMTSPAAAAPAAASAASRRQHNRAAPHPSLEDVEEQEEVVAPVRPAARAAHHQRHPAPPPPPSPSSSSAAMPSGGGKRGKSSGSAPPPSRQRSPAAEESRGQEEEDWYSAAKNRPKRRYFS